MMKLLMSSYSTQCMLKVCQVLGSMPKAYVCVCLLASILYIPVCLPRSTFCHAWCSSWACTCYSLGPLTCACLHLSLLWLVWMQPFVRTHFYDVSLLDAYLFPAPCNVILALLALCHLFGFLYFFASLHACPYVHA